MIAIIVEGKAEKAIINILLDNNLLKFQRSDILNEEVLIVRKAKIFEEKHLSFEMPEKITIYRILDSKKEKFKLSKYYKDKVDTINIITRPEIEVLILINEKEYDRYKQKKSTMKPSEYLKAECKSIKYKKAEQFIYNYFNDHNKLVTAINEYDSKIQKANDEKTLKDLLRE